MFLSTGGVCLTVVLVDPFPSHLVAILLGFFGGREELSVSIDFWEPLLPVIVTTGVRSLLCCA
jgi:hypothetical protein